ncbi:MAG: hypothetical protein JRH11_19775, partial [Deltaproteobacteria bacterium]|nr:hypothetical protein [Deltaproteobacteria bacterium]
MMRSFPQFALVVGLLAACSSSTPLLDGEADGLGPKADGIESSPLLARCTREGASLVCASLAAGVTALDSIELRRPDGRSVAIFDFSSTATAEAAVDDRDFPLTLEVRARVQHVVGLETRAFSIDVPLTAATDLATPLEVAVPFDVWPVVITNRTNVGQVRFDAYTLRLDGDVSTDVIDPGILLAAAEQRTLYLAVPPGTTALTGAAGETSAADPFVPFTIEAPGEYEITSAGLIQADGEEDSSDDELVRCVPSMVDVGTEGAPSTERHLSCAMVVREGIEVARATITEGEMQVELPTDGTSVDLGLIDSARTVRASVEIGSGISGLFETAGPLPAIEGDVTVEDAPAALTLPFGLLRVDLQLASAVIRVALSTPEGRRVDFDRQWGDVFSMRERLVVERTESGPLWIAASRGETSV